MRVDPATYEIISRDLSLLRDLLTLLRRELPDQERTFRQVVRTYEFLVLHAIAAVRHFGIKGEAEHLFAEFQALEKFLQNTSRLLRRMTPGLEQQRIETIKRLSHALAGIEELTGSHVLH